MKDTLAYLNSLGLYRVKPGLQRITTLLQALGNPHDKIRSVLIAGTNGKGSVAAGIASVLEAQGYRAGLYTSPHLVRITERIKVNGAEIPAEDFSKLILAIKEISSDMPEEPSYFEVITAAAFLYFWERKVDFSVLEAGMGGRWDATNVVSPLVSVITNISKDHTEFLGTSVQEIASEKAGIIKDGIPVVTAAQGEALETIRLEAGKKSAHLGVMGKDFGVRGESPENFSYLGQTWGLSNLYFNLPGFYQLENACLIVAALESMDRFHNVRVEKENLRKGLSFVKWEARMELLRSDPPLILDGAHNPGAAHALRISLEKMYPREKFVFLISMLRDKDYAGYFGGISGVAKSVIITELPHERAAEAEKLREATKGFFTHVRVIKDVKEALEEVIKLSAPVCITGSLYLAGEVKRMK